MEKLTKITEKNKIALMRNKSALVFFSIGSQIS